MTAFHLFNAGIGWEPSPGSRVTLTATNRAMNLDRHYPTVSVYRSPVILLTARIELRWAVRIAPAQCWLVADPP